MRPRSLRGRQMSSVFQNSDRFLLRTCKFTKVQIRSKVLTLGHSPAVSIFQDLSLRGFVESAFEYRYVTKFTKMILGKLGETQPTESEYDYLVKYIYPIDYSFLTFL